MKSAFNKDIYREIIKTLPRFFGIFAIVALGVAFYAGLAATGEAMKSLMDSYLDRGSLMDIKVVSTYGLNKKDVAAIEAVDGIESVQPAFVTDVLFEYSDNSYVIKLHSIDTDINYNELINAPKLLYGRLPDSPDEMLIEEKFFNQIPLSLGDRISLSSGKEENIKNTLKNDGYKIVGVIESPIYISAQRGSGSIGNGRTNFYGQIPAENFKAQIYSEVYVTVEGSKSLDTFKDEYADLIDITAEKIEAAGDIRIPERMREITQQKFTAINNALTDIEENKILLNAQFDSAEKEVKNQSGELSKALSSLELNRGEILEAIRALENSKEEILVSIEATQKAYGEISANKLAIEESRRIAEENRIALLNTKEEMLNMAYFMDSESYTAAMAEIEYSLSEIDESLLLLDLSRASIESGSNELDGASASLTYNLNYVNSQLEELNDSLKQIDKSKKDIAEGSRASEEALNQISLERFAVMEELNKAYNKLVAAKSDLYDLEEAEWYVLDRESNLGFISYKEDSDKITSIGQVFPMFFFLVAALVSLTSMARIVEDKRIEIGTLKSLGFSDFKILSKYLTYAIVPTFFGGLFGGYVGMKILPQIVINAYRSLYVIPAESTSLTDFYWFLGIGLGVVSTGTATVYSCINALRETPSNLMRPKSPEIGKKTLIEQIGFIWRQLGFMYKISIRNIFRYKKRLVMTVIGISGCTALLVSGFGLKNSINDIIAKQYGEIILYNFSVNFSTDVKSKDVENVVTLLNKSSAVTQSLKVIEKSYDVGAEGMPDESVRIIAFENTDSLERFINLQRRGGDNIKLQPEGAVISEKLSILLDVDIGDEVIIKDGNEIKGKAVITEIAENYFMHYLFINVDYYKEILEEDSEYNAVYSLFSQIAEEGSKDSLASEILDKKNVSSVSFMSSSITDFTDVMDSLNIVILVLIISAGILVFVVLLNLTNINIAERIREIATIEVLGFKDKEVASYIYRENMMLTVMGIGVGFALGKLLHTYVILTTESRLMMFGRDIHLDSYIYSTILTLLFAAASNLVTSRQLKKISMVEALKSVE